MGRKKSFIFAILVTGFSGIVAQILLLRELLITGFGNELSIGIILANWLMLESIGAFVVGRGIEKAKQKIELFVGFTLLFSISFPVAIVVSRLFREFLGITTGEGLGFVPMLYSSFFILLPVSLTHGALFTFACKIYSQYSQKPAQAIGRVYIYETLGTIAGGIIFTYFLVLYFHSLQIALSLALLNSLVCLLIVVPFWRKQDALSKRAMATMAAIVLIFYSYIIFTPRADKLHWFSIQRQWPGQKVLHYQNSIYGNVTVTKRAEQYTFYSDGIAVITTPTPDIAFVEEFAHLPLLFHPQPENVLVISGGAGGIINELLKHATLKKLDYAELDPLILEVVKKFPTTLTQTELNNERVNVQYIDGRLFVKRTPHRYDVILVGISNPQDLQLNRLFSEEFFLEARGILRDKGILVISLPGSLSYLSRDLRNLNACILNTLKRAYPHIRIIPGDSLNLYLASASLPVSLIQPSTIIDRLERRKLKSIRLLTPAHINYRLARRWQDWFLESIASGTEKINSDFSPLGLFYSLSYWNALFSPYMRNVFRYFEKITLRLIFILFSFFILTFLISRFKMKKISKVSIPLCIMSSGFSGMIFELALIFAFQVLYGYVFYWLGILVTTFMAGIVVGGLLMTASLGRVKKDINLFLKLEIALIVFSLILPLVLRKFCPSQVVFLILSFLGASFIGAEFPLANKIYLAPRRLSQTAGLLYGADLFGGWIGGILGGILLLPVLGLVGTCMVVAIFKLSSMIVLASAYERI